LLGVSKVALLPFKIVHSHHEFPQLTPSQVNCRSVSNVS
jgi:hypothetical protein